MCDWKLLDSRLILQPCLIRENDGKFEIKTISQNNKSMTKFVALYRVSTSKQGKSGLGLDAQAHACRRHATAGMMIKEFEEVVSGSSRKRPEFDNAVILCRKTRATLLVFKLDRLSRTLTGVPDLARQNIKLCVVSMPTVSIEMLCLLSALSVDEVNRIRKRTKEALTAKRSRLKENDPTKMKLLPPPKVVRDVGQLQKRVNYLEATRLLRTSAITNAKHGMSLRENAEQLIRDYPLAGHIDHNKVRRLISQKDKLQQKQRELVLKKQESIDVNIEHQILSNKMWLQHTNEQLQRDPTDEMLITKIEKYKDNIEALSLKQNISKQH